MRHIRSVFISYINYTIGIYSEKEEKTLKLMKRQIALIREKKSK